MLAVFLVADAFGWDPSESVFGWPVLLLLVVPVLALFVGLCIDSLISVARFLRSSVRCIRAHRAGKEASLEDRWNAKEGGGIVGGFVAFLAFALAGALVFGGCGWVLDQVSAFFFNVP